MKIIDLPEKTIISGSDYFVASDALVTSRISAESILNYTNSNISTFGVLSTTSASAYIKLASGSTSYVILAGNVINKNVPTTGNASPTQVVLGNDTRLYDSRIPLQHSHSISQIYDVDITQYVSQSMIGDNSGVAPLDADGFVPEEHLPFTVKSPVGSIFGRTGNVIPVSGDYSATLITSNPINLVTSTNVQSAIQQLSTAAGIKTTRITGSNNVDDALGSLVKKAGDTMTGGLILPDNGLRIGTLFTMLNNTIGINTSPNINYTLSIGGNSYISGDVTSRSFVNISSIKYKYDVEQIENPLDLIQKLDGVKFKWKGSHKPDFGFIAEEVDKHIPEIVQHNNDEASGVDYTKIISILVEAVKVLKLEIEELKLKK